MTNANDEFGSRARRMLQTAGHSHPTERVLAPVRYATKRPSKTNGAHRVYAIGVAEKYDSGRDDLRPGRSIAMGE